MRDVKYEKLKTACYRKLPQREEWERSGHESLCWRGQEEGHAELKIGGCDGMVEKEEEGSRADS